MGLAQREIERAGITTIALSNIPELTMAVSVPRIAGIEHPFGQIVGRPGESDIQRAVLLAALDAVNEMKLPGEVKHLPFTWTGTRKEAHAEPPVPPPIAGYLKWHPWDLPRLMSRDLPQKSHARKSAIVNR